VQIIWDTFQRDEGKYSNFHEFCRLATENVMKLAFNKKTLDNITVVLVAL
jgi:serine/threonine protein phosphatase PrpC